MYLTQLLGLILVALCVESKLFHRVLWLRKCCSRTQKLCKVEKLQ